MDPPPKGVWRQSLSPSESEQVITNLLDLDRWPSWHSSAGRILSEKTGALSEGQRFDLHRIERQRLIEDMWSVKSIRSSQAPRFLEIEFLWQGQQREGKPLGAALSNLSMTVTVWAEEGGGVEIASWWDVPWWAKFMKGRVNRLPRAMAKQWLKDACSGATLPILPSQEAFLNESE